MASIFLIAAVALAAATTTPPMRSAPMPGGTGSPPTKSELAGDQDEVICKRIATVGTRLAKSDCRSRAEWNQLAVDSREAFHGMVSNQGGCTGSCTPSYNGK